MARIQAGEQIAVTFGDKLRNYPGALESSGQQFGYFSVPLPLKGPNQRYTSKDLDDLFDGLNSTDLKIAADAGRTLSKMTFKISAGGANQEQRDRASVATRDFNEAAAAIAEIRDANDTATRQGLVESLATRLGWGPDQAKFKASDIRAMYLRGTIRPIIAGPGNPAIYEQEMVNATIPNIQAMFAIRSWDKARIGSLAIVTATGYIERMRQNGFTDVSQEAVDNINEKLKASYGEKAPTLTREDLIGDASWSKARRSPAEAAAWLEKKGFATTKQLQLQNTEYKWKFESDSSK
jgi:hypothetical protein